MRELPVDGAAGPIGLRSVAAKAKNRQKGPKQSVEPHQSDPQRHVALLEPLTYRGRKDEAEDEYNGREERSRISNIGSFNWPFQVTKAITDNNGQSSRESMYPCVLCKAV